MRLRPTAEAVKKIAQGKVDSKVHPLCGPAPRLPLQLIFRCLCDRGVLIRARQDPQRPSFGSGILRESGKDRDRRNTLIAIPTVRNSRLKSAVPQPATTVELTKGKQSSKVELKVGLLGTK